MRWVEDTERYMIVCGERRWRAAELAGLKTMSCVIMDAPVTRELNRSSLQIVENMLREDLAPMEQAKGFKALMETNGWSGTQLADCWGLPSQPLSKLSLLKLTPSVQEQVELGRSPRPPRTS